MADFCKQCSIALFGADHGDLKNIGRGETLAPGEGWVCICEGCGPTLVNDDGECISDCLEQHNPSAQ